MARNVDLHNTSLRLTRDLEDLGTFRGPAAFAERRISAWEVAISDYDASAPGVVSPQNLFQALSNPECANPWAASNLIDGNEFLGDLRT